MLGGNDDWWKNVIVALTGCDFTSDSYDNIKEYLDDLSKEEAEF